MTTTPSKPRRTTVQALDDLTAQLKLANQIKAFALGATVLEHDPGTRAKDPKAIARTERRNKLRAAIRVGVGIEEES